MIDAYGEFLESSYKTEVMRRIREGKRSILIDFAKLEKFDPAFSEKLLENPEEELKRLDEALNQIKDSLIDQEDAYKLKARIYNIPKTAHVKIRDIRADHLGKLIAIKGQIRKTSDVRPKVSYTVFACPVCSTKIPKPQTGTVLEQPFLCPSCGRKGKFKLESQELIDIQHIVVEEIPEELYGAEQPKRISTLLTEDLLDPEEEKKHYPGNNVILVGLVKEIPITGKAGEKTTKFEILLDVNSVEMLEEAFEEIKISKEDEKKIKELASDPQIYKKLVDSFANSIYGYEEIKEAIILQLFGGVKKIRPDGTRDRGDVHVLLVGDPGAGKSQLLKVVQTIAPKARYVVGKSASLDYNEPLLIRENKKQKLVKIGEFIDRHYKDGEAGFFVPHNSDTKALSLNLKTLKLEWKPIKAVFRHKADSTILSFLLETGRKIKVTKDHSIFCIENSEVKCKPSDELREGDYVAIPKKIISDKSALPKDVASFLGYYIAEGNLCNSDGSYKIQLTLNKNETDIASEINLFSKKYFGKEAAVTQHGENGIRVTIYGKEPYLKVCDWLGDIAHKKATEKGIPQIILNSNKDARQAFFDSYIKGDAGVTKSERLMSDLLYLKLQDNVIASCLERKTDRITSFKDGRKIFEKGYRFDLLSPNKNKVFRNSRLNFPISCLPENLKMLFRRKPKQGYARINLRKTDNNMLLTRILKVYEEGKIRGRDLRKFFGESSLEYFSDHSDLFQKNKIGREIEIKLTKKGIGVCEDISKIKKILEGDVAFVKIKKKEEMPAKKGFVYDISTPENENFVAGFGGVICHNSGAGITAAVVRDELLQGWALEAGALVLANKGIALIDELDKMDPEDRSAMHEAMEQQCYLPDFEITFADGSRQKIGYLVDSLMKKHKENIKKGINCEILDLAQEIKVLTTDFKSIYPIKIDRVSRHIAPDKFVKITLNNGREITVTKGHPCWTIENGKITTTPAERLKAGGLFPIPSDGKIRWSKIKSAEIIENKDIKYVYDITIEPTHSFISNNMVLHNSITISKANIQATLRAETSILGAANPKFGRFDPYSPVANQIDMPPTLINRFDLIFIVLDIPDIEKDEKMAGYILNLQKGQQEGKVKQLQVSQDFLKKYIAYAKQTCFPRLTSHAIEEIQNFYVSLRSAAASEDQGVRTVPISPRQLVSLVRLAEASARVRLSPQVLKQDAERAIYLLKACMQAVGTDPETGKFDIDRISSGISAKERSKLSIIQRIIIDLENKLGKTLPEDEIIRVAEGEGMQRSEIEEILESLKRRGDIYEPRQGVIQRMT